MHARLHLCALLLALLASLAVQAANLIEDSSFTATKAPDQFGLVFTKWGGTKYEGECNFRVGRIGHTGPTSCLLHGGAGPKLRVRQFHPLESGRYRITAYLRGLDIGSGAWGLNTEFMFNDNYLQLGKNGTFGWTSLTFVGEIKQRTDAGPSFGLWAPGYLWIDDVTLEKVGDDVPLTATPVWGKEDAPIAMPGDIRPGFVRCPECANRNMPAWKVCYACGTLLTAQQAAPVVSGPPVKPITSFEGPSPFSGEAMAVVDAHASDGKKALRLDRNWVVMEVPQDWSGYDSLQVDFYTEARKPLNLLIEIRDAGTIDYYSRVNYTSVAPPGKSTFILPLSQLFVGEKARPGRRLFLNAIRKLFFSLDEKPEAPLFIDNLRLVRDTTMAKAAFDDLYAFDFGTGASPLMDGFTPISPASLYSKGRGYGLKDARIWRSYDVLQPDPLYQDFICMESGGLAVDVPNGTYRVFVNIDNPSGYWGEYQVYRKRAILAEGKEVVAETMDFERCRQKYFRFWNVDDLPTDNVFDKYQTRYFAEKRFDVTVIDGQLNIDFRGENFGCSVSAVIMYPLSRIAEGERFLQAVQARRRFYFDNYFRRIAHQPTGDPLPATGDPRGYLVFSRDFMQDVYYNDTPSKSEIGQPLRADGFAGEYVPLTVGVLPLRDLGNVTVSAGDLSGPQGVIPAAAIDVGYISYRISRVNLEGTVSAITPRFIMPSGTVAMPKGMTRRFWLTLKTPAGAKPGVYTGSVTVKPEKGIPTVLPLTFTVRKGALDPVDIPVGPWGYTINLPWYEDDPACAAWNRQMADKSLRRMREYGFTLFSGMPLLLYTGFKDGKPTFEFSYADAQMRLPKALGFKGVVSYGVGVSGINAYAQDTAQMAAAGFTDYSAFIKAVYSAVQQHADAAGWIPVYWNLGDEPIGDDLARSIANAEAYRKAFPAGPPFFTAASSFTGGDANDPHFQLAKALHIVNWNLHDEASVNLLHAGGGHWAFYNGGNRWTMGAYMYKAVKEFDMKFFIDWHWNCNAGDPYYALDCREDDYAWCNATPTGELVPAVRFERLRAGIDDYRGLLTLARLAKEKAGALAAQAAEALIAARMAGFTLGQREHDDLFGSDDWAAFRRKVADAIEALQ